MQTRLFDYTHDDDTFDGLNPEAEGLQPPETTRLRHGVQLRPTRVAAPLSFAEAAYGYDPHAE